MSGIISVVLVEDNPLHAQRYRENLALDPLLRPAGEFRCVKDAIAGIESLAPDVALVDLELPDGSGLDVVRHVRERLLLFLFLRQVRTPAARRCGRRALLRWSRSRRRQTRPAVGRDDAGILGW